MIARDVHAAAASRHDLIVGGGGIQGAMLALEAARRGLRPLLVERDDHGQHTSWNSLRIVHSGLRYLQSADLRRFAESIAERRWLLASFPELIRRLLRLMPLYGRGAHRASVLRLALRANDMLWRSRNADVRNDRRVPAGRVVDAAECARLFPDVPRDGLEGGALWHDAVMPDSPRLLVETLRWAASRGAVALNYVEATGLLVERGAVAGGRAVERASGAALELAAPVVIGCAGPWSRELARAFDRDVPELFHPSLAFNLVLDRAPLAGCAVALRAPRRAARIYFVHELAGRLFAGTYHAPWDGPPEASGPETLRAFLADLDEALPGPALGDSAVVRAHWGHLPVERAGGVALTARETLHDHGAAGGPRGLYSVCGIKFTTARAVAERVLRRVFGGALRAADPSPPDAPRAVPDAAGALDLLERSPDEAARLFVALVASESVRSADDLLLRRTSWGLDDRAAARLGPLVSRVLAPGAAP